MGRYLLMSFWLIGCGDDPAMSLLPPAPQGGGYCCPIESPACGCFRTGGWSPNDDPQMCRPGTCDLAPPYVTNVDEHGCDWIGSDYSCLITTDAGAVAVDASPADAPRAP